MGNMGMIGTGVGILFIIVLAIVIVVVLSIVLMYNSLVRLRNAVEEAFSTMDIYMKKRFDLIPNLVETVKAYAAHEKDTLERVIAARNMASAGTPTDKMAGEAALSVALKSLFAVAENYPQLRANENFLGLQHQLQGVEEDIANARKYYNGTVRIYNTKTETLPSALVAGLFRFTKKPLYEVTNESERENVKVQF